MEGVIFEVFTMNAESRVAMNSCRGLAGPPNKINAIVLLPKTAVGEKVPPTAYVNLHHTLPQVHPVSSVRGHRYEGLIPEKFQVRGCRSNSAGLQGPAGN